MLHGVQHFTGVKTRNESWPIWEYQACLLSYEAAGVVAERIIGIELFQDGVHGPLAIVLAGDEAGVERIYDAYKQALKNGTPYARALEEAGKVAFYRQFETQWWLNGYNETVFLRYLDFWYRNDFKTPSSDNPYTLDRMRMTGYVSKDFNMTAGLDSIPANMFGDNDKMRRAFEWMNYHHVARTMGEGSLQGQELFTKLKAEGNPYMGVDPMLVYHLLVACNINLSVTSIMDYMAAHPFTPQQAPPLKKSVLKAG